MHVLVMRGNKALARPLGSSGGPLPTLSDIQQFVVIIDSYEHSGIRVITSSTGQPPDDWQWISLFDIQAALEWGPTSDAIGEAVLCGGL